MDLYQVVDDMRNETNKYSNVKDLLTGTPSKIDDDSLKKCVGNCDKFYDTKGVAQDTTGKSKLISKTKTTSPSQHE